jgi:hypothetical protein
MCFSATASFTTGAVLMPESPSGAPSCLSRCRELVGMDDGTAIVDGPNLPFAEI